ncbi:MAG: TlpA family protein disulfide reductase [Gammaproteobacteria bacterium]|nr:TlpA family protein disulfide reductase [Gammaproteobacteria bacterium]
MCKRTTIAALCMVMYLLPASADNGLTLPAHPGKVVVVDFWASWCVPCRRSFPWMNEMQRKYGEDGLVIIGVNLDADATAADEFLREVPADFQIVRDPQGDLARSYNIIAMPSSVIFDRDGEIATRHNGFKVKKQDEYEALLADLLKRPEGEQR